MGEQDMRSKVLTAASAATLLFCGLAANAASAPGQALVDIEAKWAKAMVDKDAKALDSILAPTFASQGASGKVNTKAGALNDLTSGKLVVRSMTNHDVHVRIIGNVAIVQGMDDEDSTYDGKPFKGTFTWMDVYEKQGGKWLAIASQGTAVDAKK